MSERGREQALEAYHQHMGDCLECDKIVCEEADDLWFAVNGSVSIARGREGETATIDDAVRADWRATHGDHPWTNFLDARRWVIEGMLKDGKTFEQIAASLSMDPGQVRLIHMTLEDRRTALARREPEE